MSGVAADSTHAVLENRSRNANVQSLFVPGSA